MLLILPNLMAADDNNEVMIELKVNNDTTRFNDFKYDIFNAADSTGVSFASAVSNKNVLKLWGSKIEKGGRYFIIITPYNKPAQKSGSGAKVNLGGGISAVSGGTLPSRDPQNIMEGENIFRVDVDIPADFQTDEKRQIGWSATPKFIPVLILPDLNISN